MNHVGHFQIFLQAEQAKRNISNSSQINPLLDCLKFKLLVSMLLYENTCNFSSLNINLCWIYALGTKFSVLWGITAWMH